MSDVEERFALRAAAGRLLNRVRVAFDNGGDDLEVSQDNPLPVAIVSGSSGGGGSGDASAANQTAQLARQGAIADAAVTDPAAEASQIAAAKGLLSLAGARTEAAPASDTAASGLNGRLQRIAQRLTSMLTALGVTRTTRLYDVANGIRPAVAAATGNAALPVLGATREVYIHTNVRTFFRTGNSGSVTAAIAAGHHVVAADEKFHWEIPAGHTHIAVIGDGGTGFATIVAAA